MGYFLWPIFPALEPPEVAGACNDMNSTDSRTLSPEVGDTEGRIGRVPFVLSLQP